jgi:hypothetical protein
MGGPSATRSLEEGAAAVVHLVSLPFEQLPSETRVWKWTGRGIVPEDW